MPESRGLAGKGVRESQIQRKVKHSLGLILQRRRSWVFKEEWLFVQRRTKLLPGHQCLWRKNMATKSRIGSFRSMTMESEKAGQGLLSLVYRARSMCCSKNTSFLGLATPYHWGGDRMPDCLEARCQETNHNTVTVSYSWFAVRSNCSRHSSQGLWCFTGQCPWALYMWVYLWKEEALKMEILSWWNGSWERIWRPAASPVNILHILPPPHLCIGGLVKS